MPKFTQSNHHININEHMTEHDIVNIQFDLITCHLHIILCRRKLELSGENVLTYSIIDTCH